MDHFNQVNQIVDGLAPELKALAAFLHQNPEVGLQEHQACAAQKDLLEKHGFTVETNVYGFETAYHAVYASGKPGLKIAMLAEYDALPELGHACGHNLIAMVGVGAGIAMQSFANQYGGEIHVFGTPAEESMGAKVTMAKEGAFDHMDVAMMSHPMDHSMDYMNTMGINAIRIKYHGKPAHAAGAPEQGVNALDAAIGFFNLTNALRQQTREDARMHGIIVNGGTASNVIPDYTEVVYCVRAAKRAYLQELTEKVRNCAQAAALATGCTVEMEKADEDFLDTNTNTVLAELSAKQVEKLGHVVRRSGGATTPGSSDMGDVSYACPALQSTFDICRSVPTGAHTAEFAQAAGSEHAMDMALLYIKSHVLTAIELMTDPSHMEAIRAEFAAIKQQ